LTDRYVAIEKRDDFQDVRRALYRFIFPATIAFVLWYALYVALSTFARDFMSVRIAGTSTLPSSWAWGSSPRRS